MKILYIKLKNFIGFKSGLGVNEIEIDFSSSDNRIILLTGENGCGKTTLLSCLNPFSNTGSIDVRNDNSLIIPNKDGYKEIHYQVNNDVYKIKHYYTPKSTGSHSVKSYIEKNGIELNPNGNVTSFKDLVKQELDMEQDYLRLMRLGSNVSGFIDAKSTERKSYVGKILEDVDLFLKYHKQTTTTVRELKSITSHTSDKLNKLGISSIDNFEKDIKKYEKEVIKLDSSLEDINNKLAITNNELSKLHPDKDRLSTLKSKMKKVDKKIDSDISLNDCESNLSQAKDKLTVTETKIETETKYRQEKLDELSTKYNKKNELENIISGIKSSSRIIDSEKELKQIISKINEITEENSEFLKEDFVTYSKNDVERLISIITTCNELGDNIKSYNRDSLYELQRLYQENIDVSNYLSKAYKELDNRDEKSNKQLLIMLKELNEMELACSDSSCPLYRFWNKYRKDETDIEIDNLNDREFYDALSIQNTLLNNINLSIDTMNDFLNKLPIEYKISLSTTAILDNLVNLKDGINISIFNKLLTKVTEYDYYQSLVNKKDILKEQLQMMKRDTKIGFYEDSLSELNGEIEQLRKNIDTKSNEITKLNSDKKELSVLLEELHTLYDVLTNKKSYEEEIKTLEKELEEHSNLTSKLRMLTINKATIEQESNRIHQFITTSKYKINEYNILSKDLIKLNDKLNTCLLIQRSLSTKEGIPLKFIENYFNSANELTNKLLYSIYGNNLQIDKFVINADSFTIPYMVRNVKVPDVIYSSQGEKSFISIALSFALATQSLGRYNIMLLDEVDSPLDTSNREKFIDIIEKQCDIVDAEQIFLISHNNMFNMYPVDVINMNNEKNNEMQLASYIDIKKK